MAFVVEDGTGSNPLANSFVSVAEADSYFLDRNFVEWASYTDIAKQAALIYGTSYIDNIIAWSGYLVSYEQPLAWPRTEFIDSNGRTVATNTVPTAVKNAVCELAAQHTSEGLNEETVGVASETIGDSSITYGSGGSSSPRYFTFIKSMIKHLGFTGAGSNSDIYRG